MTRPEQDRIWEEAADWHARLDSPEMDWDAFGDWLDADPVHRTAYDEIALLDTEIGAHGPTIKQLLSANDDDRPAAITSARHIGRPQRRWWWGGGLAIAASMVALLTPQLPFFAGTTPVGYRTGPGETRVIALRDGSQVTLDRNSELALNDGPAPRIDMKYGSAWFDVRHDPERAMVVSAGGYEVTDIGTKFEMTRSADHLAVSVAEGRVSVAPEGSDGTPVLAGQRFDVAPRTAQASLRTVDPDAMGSWRDGRLIYDNAPLSLVAVDLSRYAGRPVSVGSDIADMRLSGVLNIGDGSRLVGDIEALLPVEATIGKDRIRLHRARRP